MLSLRWLVLSQDIFLEKGASSHWKAPFSIYLFNFIIMPLLFIMTSCYSRTIQIKSDGSGLCVINSNLDSSISQFFATILTEETSINTNVFLFSNEKTIRERMALFSNNRLRNVKIINNQNNKTINIDYAFSKYEKLDSFFLDDYITTEIKEDKNNLIIITTINMNYLGNEDLIKDNYQQIPPHKKEIIDAFLKNMNINLTYVGAHEITKTTGTLKGIISKNQKEITYTTNLYDLINNKVTNYFSITFRK